MVYSISYATRQNTGHNNGETYRPLANKFVEHWRSANNPAATSYKDIPFEKHDAAEHPGYVGSPQLKLQIITRASTTTEMKS